MMSIKRCVRRLCATRTGRGTVVGVALFAAACGALYLYFHNPYTSIPLPCAFYMMTGYYCPGCGSGRASYYLLHGRFHQAFIHNRLMIILLPFLGLYSVVAAYQWIMTGEIAVNRHIPARFLRIILIILILYAVIRNIPLYPFNALAPGGRL